MTTYDNAPSLEGWTTPPPKHCGEWCLVRDCPVCGTTLPMPDCDLGEN